MQKNIVWMVIDINILDCIGNTPLLSIGKIYFKLESANPSGSIKDRIAKAMILDFIQKHKDYKRYTIVEATSGNTGISVAMVCASLGLRCKIYAPICTSNLKIKMMKAYGADVATVHDTISECIECAKSWNDGRFHHYLDQFNNKYNIRAQAEMAQEAQEQLTNHYVNAYWGTQYWDIKYYGLLLPDAIVAGVGTGGTLMGLHKVFPDAKVFMVQVPDSEHIEGICDGVKLSLIPRKLQLNAINVTFIQAVLTTKWLAEKHGIHCGISSGANYYASRVIQNKYKRILTVFPDSGDRYL